MLIPVALNRTEPSRTEPNRIEPNPLFCKTELSLSISPFVNNCKTELSLFISSFVYFPKGLSQERWTGRPSSTTRSAVESYIPVEGERERERERERELSAAQRGHGRLCFFRTILLPVFSSSFEPNYYRYVRWRFLTARTPPNSGGLCTPP